MIEVCMFLFTSYTFENTCLYMFLFKSYILFQSYVIVFYQNDNTRVLHPFSKFNTLCSFKKIPIFPPSSTFVWQIISHLFLFSLFKKKHSKAKQFYHKTWFLSTMCQCIIYNIAECNQDGMVTHLEPDIRESELMWVLGNITMNKAGEGGGDRIQAELFKILKDHAVKVLHSIFQQIWKTQQWPQD